MACGVSYASISARVDLDFQTYLGVASASSACARNLSFGATWLCSKLPRPSHGSSRSRTRSRIGPMGPAVVLTRSISSEYRMGAGKCSLFSAVPPRNRSCSRRNGSVKRSMMRAADDQVLLDLPLLRPRNDVAPRDDVHHRNHSSRSGGRRTITCHRSFRSVGFGDKSGSPPVSVRVRSTEAPDREAGPHAKLPRARGDRSDPAVSRDAG